VRRGKRVVELLSAQNESSVTNRSRLSRIDVWSMLASVPLFDAKGSASNWVEALVFIRGVVLFQHRTERGPLEQLFWRGITMRFRRSIIDSLVLAVLASVCAAEPVAAQARCDEATVRRLAAVSVTELASPDLYFNVQTGLPPVVGLAQLEALRVKHANERKNEQPHVFTILQVNATTDGSMAYDDGSVHVEFDDAKTGKHVAYDLSYLRVWKVVGGKCVTAATYARRGDQERRP
jgi:hypothetical protein